MSVQDDRRVAVPTTRSAPGPACPPWCALDRAHVDAGSADGVLLHRGMDDTVTCRGSGPVPRAVEVRIRRQLRVEYDHGLAAWVPDPQPTVHVSELPSFALRPQDAVALAVALVTAGSPEPRSGS